MTSRRFSRRRRRAPSPNAPEAPPHKIDARSTRDRGSHGGPSVLLLLLPLLLLLLLAADNVDVDAAAAAADDDNSSDVNNNNTDGSESL